MSQTALRIVGIGLYHFAIFIETGCSWLMCTFHDTGFEWDFSYGLGGVEDLPARAFSFCFLYHNWLYLVNLLLMIPDSTGIFAVAETVLNIGGL